jgi:hypothetical protein
MSSLRGHSDFADLRYVSLILGVDGRSSASRRYADVLAALSIEHPDADITRLREITSIKVAIELTTADVLSGERPARADLVRLSNLLTRRERGLHEALVIKTRQEPLKDCSTPSAALSSRAPWTEMNSKCALSPT